jgi:hypothetical protein
LSYLTPSRTSHADLTLFIVRVLPPDIKDFAAVLVGVLRTIQMCVAANASKIGGYATFDTITLTEPLIEVKATDRKLHDS